jgi:hypothetical protein
MDDIVKVHRDFATINDFKQHVLMKMRESVEMFEETEKLKKALEVAIERAGGDMNTLLKDVNDQNWKG